MTVLQRCMIAFLVLLAAPLPAAAQAPVPPPDCRATAGAATAPTPPPIATAAHADWWTDQRWRYDGDAQAEAAYQALLARQSPWPEWHQSNLVVLPAGLRIQMAIAPGQSPQCPGGFGTFDRIPDVAFVRLRLAVKTAWKPAIDRVVTYEITAPLIADVGTVGPQIDAPADRYLPGGGSQFQMMMPAAERMQHLRVVEVRAIR
jgi:hypothetical protein